MGIRGFEQYNLLREELLVLNAQAIFWLLFFVGINFYTKKSTEHSLFYTAIYKCSSNPIPPQDHLWSKLKRGLRRRNGSIQKWGGVCCKGKGWRYGGEDEGGRNQEDYERGFGMCKVCDGEE